ncbi:hypothetical protein [Nocardia cyriacigeorgica]|nr:hypothetical protein [Nocardia cyriacigeorgica]
MRPNATVDLIPDRQEPSVTRVFTSLDDVRAALGEQIGPSDPRW